MIKTKTIEERVEEMCSALGMPCCEVCACDHGKKIWCACHREQLRKALQDHEKQVLEEEIKVLEGMKKKSNKYVPFQRVHYQSALHDLITLKQQQLQEAKELLDNK